MVGMFQINLIAPPTYVLTCQTLEKETGIKKINDAMEVVKGSLEAEGGLFKVVMEVSLALKCPDFNRDSMQKMDLPTLC